MVHINDFRCVRFFFFKFKGINIFSFRIFKIFLFIVLRY